MVRNSHGSPHPHRILVVDHQPEALASVCRLLERQGYEVLRAASAAEALRIFDSHDVHLLVVDSHMPDMSGEALVREVRRIDSSVQILLLTDAAEKPAAELMAELDIQGYHDTADGPDKLLLWVAAGLKAYRLVAALRERERVQQELVSNISHELRTPLHIIGGYTELMLDGAFGELPPAAQDSLRRVSTATDTLGALVADLLSFAKLQAGTHESTPQWVATDEVVGEIERLALLLLEDSTVQFAVDVADAPAVFRTDLAKLRTILRNLVTNAVKFTPRGAIVLRVAGTASGLSFSVRDTGIGIAAPHHAMIFEPFRQLDPSPTRRYRGIGLGLALARKLARTLGGDITLESEPGAGSSFTLCLPRADTARAATPADASASGPAAKAA